MKKYALIFFFAVLGALPFGSRAATLSLSPSGGGFTVGAIIPVAIILNTQGAAIEGADISSLNYNPALLEVQDEDASMPGVQIVPGSLMPTVAVNSVDSAQGKIAFSQVTSGTATFMGMGPLASIRFKVLAAGSAIVAFDFTAGNTADTNVAAAGADILTSVANGLYTLNVSVNPITPLPPILSLSPLSTARVTGEIFSEDIVLDTRGSAIDGVEVSLDYNRGLLKALDDDATTTGVQIVPGTILPITKTNAVSSFGNITFSQITAGNQTFTGSGVLATVHFQALASGVATMTFRFTKASTINSVVSFAGVNILGAVNNASISIVENGQPPIISDLQPSDIIPLAGSVKLQAITNEAAVCRYAFTPNTAYALMTRSFSSLSGGTEHAATLFSSSFQDGANSFFVRCADRAGNANSADAVISFTVVADAVPPVVSAPSPQGTFFLPKNINISVSAGDQSGILGCKFSKTPGVSYDLMTRSLFPKFSALSSVSQDNIFSTLVYSSGFSSDLVAGENSFFVKCKDKAGNANAADTVISFTLSAAPILRVGAEGIAAISSRPFSLSLFSAGSSIETTLLKAYPDKSGDVALSVDNRVINTLITPGVYDIFVSSDNYLRKKLTGVNLDAGTSITIPMLLAGDFNNDGTVNSVDWSIMDRQWGAGFGAAADINKDRRVNAIDWGFVRKNWLLRGD